MAKQAALYSKLWIGGNDLSGDVNAVNQANALRGTYDATGLDVRAMERLHGRCDGDAGFTSFFNDAAGQAHPVLAALPRTDVGVMWAIGQSGATSIAAGDPAFRLVAKQADYSMNRPSDGSLTFTSTFQANNYGAEWGEMLTAGAVTQGTAGALASLDNTASTTDGLVAHLQVLAFTGTSITVAIQESSDDGAGDTFAAVTGATFTAATGVGTQRVATATGLTVERYLRVSTSGTFSNAVFAVAVTRR